MAVEENKIYVSGDLRFMKDDPGRQTIGSFNPLTNDDVSAHNNSVFGLILILNFFLVD